MVPPTDSRVPTSQLTTLYPEKSSLASELSGHPPVVEGMIMGLKGFEGTKTPIFSISYKLVAVWDDNGPHQ